MGHLSLTSAFAVWALAFPFPRPAGPLPAPLPQLSKEEDEWTAKKYKEASDFGRKGMWGYDEAQAPVREILDLCTRKLGKDHYETAKFHREIEILEKLAKLPVDDRVEYMKTYVHYDEMTDLWQKRKLADALKRVEQSLTTYRRLLGPDATYVAMAEAWRGNILRDSQKYEPAEQALRESLRIRLKVLGENNPETVESYLYLGTILDRRSKLVEAGEVDRKALEIAQRLFGNRHWRTAVALNNVAYNYERQARFADAEDMYRQALSAFIALGGEEGPGVSRARTNLAVTMSSQGKYAGAESEAHKALAILQKATPRDEEEIAFVTANLATNLDNQARHKEAEHLHRSALDTYIRIHGESHSRVAEVHSNLAVNLDHQGRYAEAETHLDKAVKIYAAIPGGDRMTGAAAAYLNLASCLAGQEKHAESFAAAEKAVAIYKAILPADHPRLAISIHNLGSCLKNQEKFADAEPRFRTAVATLEKRLAKDHPDTARARNSLGINLHYLGRFAEADRLHQSALDSLRRVVGEGHLRTAATYKSLVANYCALGEYAKAAATADLAVASFEAARLRLGFGGLDRSLCAADISPLPALAVAYARLGKRDLAWHALERNMARGLLDHLAAQNKNPDERKAELALIEKISLLDRQINELRDRKPQTDADREKIKTIESQRNAAQTELVAFQAGVMEKHGVTAGKVYELPDIQKQIPEDAALLAWVDLPGAPGWWDPKGDHWVCLVKRTGAPVWVQLRGTGNKEAWTGEDDRLAQQFRNSVNERHPKQDWKELKGRLARQRFEPLKDELKGLRHLIILPSAKVDKFRSSSAVMAGIPVEALTDLTVSYAPSGTMFAWLREKRTDGMKKPDLHLLAVGDPAFKKSDTGPTALPATREELAGISRLFELTREFKGAEATEQNLDRVATEEGGLRRFPYLHFATHGTLDQWQPMRSALLLARGSEKDPLQQLLDGKVVYDGRLTAERMLRRWKLNAELVTLSACQTGLGREAGGEGYLGFSQALFAAGARSLVVSLWEVDDRATALLMTRFYENLIGLPADASGGPVEAMSKAEALKEAKQWLRGLRPDEVDQLTAGLPSRGTRGLRGRVVKKDAEEKPALSFELPYYWSGFILVGDSR
jgi:CHAT domain-containing protein/Flp pilus assembly protein TadD